MKKETTSKDTKKGAAVISNGFSFGGQKLKKQ
jgi:hypothetical protein